MGTDARKAGNLGAATMVVEEVLMMARKLPGPKTPGGASGSRERPCKGYRSQRCRESDGRRDRLLWVQEVQKLGHPALSGQDRPMQPAENATDVLRQIDRFVEVLENRGTREIEIDLRQVRFFTQELYATLARLDRQLGPPGRLRLCEVREAPLAALRVMGWDKDFEFLSPGEVPSGIGPSRRCGRIRHAPRPRSTPA